MTTGFNWRMTERQELMEHALCVGLDPEYANIPDRFCEPVDPVSSILNWMKAVVDETAEYATSFKLQMAYYECHGWKGVRALEDLLQYIRRNHPDIPVILDGKRGDINRTQAKYRGAMFDALRADGTNVSPYMGREPLVDMFDRAHPERGIITLVYTSNPGARIFQDAIVVHPTTGEQMPIWQFQALLSLGWAEEIGLQNLGFVMAAAHDKDGGIYSDHLRLCRGLDAGKAQYLVPGFGAQGGYVEATIAAGWAGWGSMYLSASSSICQAPSPREEARKLAEQMGEAIARLPVTI